MLEHFLYNLKYKYSLRKNYYKLLYIMSFSGIVQIIVNKLK